MWYLFVAISLYALLWGLFGYFMQTNFAIKRGFFIEVFPRSVIIINWLLALIVIGGIRVIARFIFNEYNKYSIFYSKKKTDLNNVDDNQTRVLIYGAGSAGIGIAQVLKQAMLEHNRSEEEASNAFFIVDQNG